MNGHPTPQSSAAAVLRMIQGLHVSRAVYVAAKLEIADLLADGAKSFDDLVRQTHTDPRSLYRVLRLLAALGVFVEVEPKRFALSPLGERLQTGVPCSMHAYAIQLDALGGLRPFDHVLDAVRDGAHRRPRTHEGGIRASLCRRRPSVDARVTGVAAVWNL